MNFAQMLATPVKSLEEQWRRPDRREPRERKLVLTPQARANMEARQKKIQDAFPDAFTSGDLARHFGIRSGAACHWCDQMLKHGYTEFIGWHDLAKTKPVRIFGWKNNEG